MDDIITMLKGKTLTDIAFVEDDYIRLDFEGNMLSLYQWPVVKTGNEGFEEDNDKYREALAALRTKKVTMVHFAESETLEIAFENDNIRLQLTSEEESFYFKTASGAWMAC